MTARQPSLLPVEFGNAHDLDTHETGWMIGFSDWTKDDSHHLRHVPAGTWSAGLCVKWFCHAEGDPNGEDKPISVGRTMSILVSESSEFRIDFSADPAFPPESTLVHTLRHQGDFLIWGPGVHHRAFGLKPATIMTVRWEPQPCAASIGCTDPAPAARR